MGKDMAGVNDPPEVEVMGAVKDLDLLEMGGLVVACGLAEPPDMDLDADPELMDRMGIGPIAARSEVPTSSWSLSLLAASRLAISSRLSSSNLCRSAMNFTSDSSAMYELLGDEDEMPRASSPEAGEPTTGDMLQ